MASKIVEQLSFETWWEIISSEDLRIHLIDNLSTKLFEVFRAIWLYKPLLPEGLIFSYQCNYGLNLLGCE